MPTDINIMACKVNKRNGNSLKTNTTQGTSWQMVKQNQNTYKIEYELRENKENDKTPAEMDNRKLRAEYGLGKK
jgi:hypothetical protein